MKASVNAWLAQEETIDLLLRIVNAAPEVGCSEVGGVIGKLVIELTQKDACYSAKVWANIAGALVRHLKDPGTTLNGYMLALVLKLALCCYNRLEQKAYSEVETEGIRKLWLEVVKSLMTKSLDQGRQQYREVAILFLLQTILKPRGEAVLSELFESILPQLVNAEMRSRHYELFLKVYSVLSLETEVMKVCSDLLGSILLKGVEPQLGLLDFSRLNIGPAFNKLLDICAKQKQDSDKLASLENLAPLESGVNTALFEQLVKSPGLIQFVEESKMQSANYYLHALVQLAQPDERKAAGEQLQENIFGLVQYYMDNSYSPAAGNVNQLVFIQSILHMYILYTDTMLSQGLVLPSAGDIIAFLSLATDHATRLLDAEILHFFGELLGPTKPELLPLSGVLKDLALLFPDLKTAVSKLELPEVDVSFLAMLAGGAIMPKVADKLKASFGEFLQDSEKRHRAFVAVIDTHFSPPIESLQPSASVCKSLTSTLQLLGAFTKLSDTMFRLGQCTPQSATQLLVKISTLALSTGDHNQMNTQLAELCKATNIGPLQSSVSGLVTMDRISQSLKAILKNDVLLKSHPIPTQKAIEQLLELWSSHANNPALGGIKEAMEDAVAAKDLANYDFATGIADIAALLSIQVPVPVGEVPMHVLVTLHDCIAKKADFKDALGILQEQLIKLDNGFFQALFMLKNANHSLHNILSSLMTDSAPLKQKLFTILLELITSNPNTEKTFLKEHLKLLSEVISQKRDSYLGVLLDKLLVWAQSCGNDELQSTILNYLSSTCYPDFAVQYPKEQTSARAVVETGEEIVDGYGVAQYVKKEEPAKPGLYCTFARTRRKNDAQPWYHCHTCNLTESKGCCAVCAKLCHKGHKLSFAKVSQMSCSCHNDCDCQALPRDYDSFESDHSSAYYLNPYKKAPAAYKEREYEIRSSWGGDDHNPPPVPFSKLMESSTRIREQALSSQLMNEGRDEGSESSDELVIEDEESPEKMLPIEEPPASSLAVPPVPAPLKSEQSPSEPSFDEKASLSFEAPLPPRDISYESTYVIR